MDPRLLRYYTRELHFAREMGAEFAREFPKIAGRLGLEGLECADPYVERLLEGFAFLTARVQLKIDAEFPRFTQHLTEMVHPGYLAPTPSMAVVQLEPSRAEGALAAGFPVPRGTVLRSRGAKGDVDGCEYRTAHDVVLWPIEIAAATYHPHQKDVAALGLPDGVTGRAAFVLRLQTVDGSRFTDLALDELAVQFAGSDEQPMRIYEQWVSNGVAVVVRPVGARAGSGRVSERAIEQIGFGEDECLLPAGDRGFSGHRLLQEYFAFPERFLSCRLTGLAGGVRACVGSALEIVVVLDAGDPRLENAVDAANFALMCTPAVNLFPKRADRIHLNDRDHEFLIVPDRTRPIDFEVWDVRSAVGYGAGTDPEVQFQPLYGMRDREGQTPRGAYYTLQRTPRLLSDRQKRDGPRSSYVGSEVWIALVDSRAAPYPSDLKQLGIELLCTNRDLPLQMPVGKGDTDFVTQASIPAARIRCIAGPTAPRASHAHGEIAWRLISHLSLNYLSLVGDDEHGGAAALREMLSLYGDANQAHIARQVQGVRSVHAEPVTRRLPVPGPVTFGRGLHVKLELDEAAFEGTGAFLLGAVLERFFARYVSINSFTETAVATAERGEIIRWPVRTGLRPTL